MLGLARPSMLREEPEVPAQVLPIQAARVRPAADVRALGSGEEDDLPAGLMETVVPVRLLAEEEEVLVREADLVDRLPPDQHAGAHHAFDLACLVVVEVTRVEGVQRPASGCELAQEEVLGREPPERGKSPNRTLQGPIRVRQPRPDEGRVRARVGELDDPTKRVADEPGVRVQEEHVAALGVPNPGVPARGEAQVLGLDHAYLRKGLSHERDGPVARAVVDDDGRHASHALETALDPWQRVVRDDDHRDVNHARPVGASLRAALPRAGSRRRAAP